MALPCVAQNDSLAVKTTQIEGVDKETVTSLQKPYNPLAPSKAAFYSAVVPGLGQAYNDRYWKIPIIYAGIGAGVYFYIQNDEDYDRFRNAYKRRLAGFQDDEFQGISDDRLIDAQRTAQKNKDISIIVSLLFYLINIVDANVDAHLQQYNVTEDLTLQPNIDFENPNTQANYGLSLKFSLK
jgi:hypothetical protein